ncbi:MAG: diaminopimelate decarboxylase [bacterium]
MKERISEETITRVLTNAVKNKLLNDDNSSLIFYDLDYLQQRVENMLSVFPDSTLHAVAIKSNPLPAVLRLLRKFSLGAEAATIPEVYLAEKSGYKAKDIVFDSPAKTRKDIEYVLKKGYHINADSLNELDRINVEITGLNTKSTSGLRINPQTGMGDIHITSTAGKYSKLGVPLDDRRELIQEYYVKYKWLNGVHLHIGSQGYSVDQLIKGIEKVYDFIEDVNSRVNHRISIFDIGGGLPVSYKKNQKPPSVKSFVNKLKKECPHLFTDKYKLITEYGRYIHANTGWVASRVEYIKKSKDRNTAVIHVGSDLLMRRCYFPQQWHHEISVRDKLGNEKRNKKEMYTIAGPLCFQGDIIALNIELPEIEEGDYIVIHDTGAYTLSMWNRHLSRQIPLTLGYFNEGARFITLKEKESLKDIYKFWQ